MIKSRREEFLLMRIRQLNVSWLLCCGGIATLLLGFQPSIQAAGDGLNEPSRRIASVRPLVGTEGGGNTFPGQAAMLLSNGKTFTMTAQTLSGENIYVQSVRLNGTNWDSPFLPYNTLKNGGTLEFMMGSQPSNWGVNPNLPD